MVLPKLNPPKKRQTRPFIDTNLENNDDDDTETPVTPRRPPTPPVKLAPYPSKQLFVLGCCRFSEPVAMTSSFPYLFFMIRDFHLTEDEKEIGRYAGFLASCFSFAQFFSGLPWGRLSDSYGRKPIVLMGLLGTVSATLVFGFSTSFTQALLARTAAGLLNGNVGVIRTMVAEMVVERAHQARAFSVMPFVWSAGSIIGPVLGGALADPAKQYPALFGGSKFFIRFPYALPNLVTAGFLFVSAFFGFLYMKETLDSKKDRDDLGIRLRRFVWRVLVSFFRIITCKRRKPKMSKRRQRTNSIASQVSEFSSDDEDATPSYKTHRRQGSAEPMLLSPGPQKARRPSAYYRYRRRSSSFSALVRPTLPKEPDQTPPPRFKDILTKQVVVNMVVYAGLALHTISFDQLFPLLCSTKVEDGGLGMTPGQIGAALSVAGVMAMVLQITVFPWGHNRWGGLRCLRVVLGMYAALYFCVPFLPKILKADEFDNSPEIWGGITLVLLVKVFAGVFAFPICAILITQSSPSRELLGTVNGTNQALGSLCRAIGPSIAGVMYSRSLEVSKPWIVWRLGLGIFAIVVFIGGWFLSDENRLPNPKGYNPVEDRDEEDIIEEELEDEEERLWREEEDGIIDIEGAASQGKQGKSSMERSRSKRTEDDDDGSSDDEFVQGVSNHLLSREH